MDKIKKQNKKTKQQKTKTCLKTMGEGTQNLTRVFLIFSCRVSGSKHHEVCSLAEGPAVGSRKRKTKKEKNYEVKERKRIIDDIKGKRTMTGILFS